MNNRILQRCYEVAAALSPSAKTGKSMHFSMAIYKSKIISIGINNYCKLHPRHKFGRYTDHKGFTTEYRASLHSEVNLATKLGEENWHDYEIVNLRINSFGKMAMACPCVNCQKLIINPMKPRRLFYSDAAGNFQEHNFNQQ